MTVLNRYEQWEQFNCLMQEMNECVKREAWGDVLELEHERARLVKLLFDPVPSKEEIEACHALMDSALTLDQKLVAACLNAKSAWLENAASVNHAASAIAFYQASP